MGWFSHDSEHAQAHQQLAQSNHKASVTHELIGGAAAYEAMKAYEEHEARHGKIDEHAKAKEVVAGIVGAFVDREVETKGLDFIDREKAKHHAQKEAEYGMQQSGRW